MSEAQKQALREYAAWIRLTFPEPGLDRDCRSHEIRQRLHDLAQLLDGV